MKTHILYIIILISICFVGCKKDEKKYIGKPIVEFTQNQIFTKIPFIMTKDSTFTFKVQLSSKVSNVERSIQIEEYGKNTAVKDTHYNIKDYKAVISKDSTFAIFYITVKSINIVEGDSISVSFKISDISDVHPSANFDTCKIIITKQTFMDVFTGTYHCVEPSSQGSFNTTFIRGTTSNTTKELNFWNFPGKGQTLTYTFTKDSTMKVEILKQTWIDQLGYTYLVSGIGKYDKIGNIEMDYKMYLLPDKTVPYDSGHHTFTRLY